MRLTQTLKLTITVLTLALLTTACSDSPSQIKSLKPGSDLGKRLQMALLDARPGDVIVLPAGKYDLLRPLSLTVDGVTIRGAGHGADRGAGQGAGPAAGQAAGQAPRSTILSFKNQITGAEGMLVIANDFTLEDIAIEDTRGDGLKINEGKNITLRRVRVEWTNGPDTGNGAYGLYPVQTENTLIEESVAIGASDAGIYVGQSRNVIVRNNYVAYNVAGIEIENTVDADVYDNIATHNTGGILVFNMPDLTLNGVRTRVFNNQITHNNTANFAKPGGPVAGVPAGSGVVINSNDQVEVFANDMQYNQTAHILISSVYSSNYSEREAAAGFDPYPEMIAIHGNRYEGGGDRPGADYLTTLKNAAFGKDGRFPNVIWDGFINIEKSVNHTLPPELQICIYNEKTTGVFNVDAPNNFANPRLETTIHQCRHAPLPPVELAGM